MPMETLTFKKFCLIIFVFLLNSKEESKVLYKSHSRTAHTC